MRRCRAKNSAFAAVTAIVLLGLVASVLAAMAMMFAADARRTRNAAADAQLRQLLIAGAADVQQRVNAGQTTFDVKLAAPAEGAMHLSATAEGDAVRAVIAAALGTRRGEQTLRFTREGERWKVAAVELHR
jgi:Na+-transporting NADH:ubiquinone oxidoreductase subunit NqrC